MIIIDDIEQGSAEWIMLRLGVLTASNAAKLITPLRLMMSGQRDTVINTLVAEALLHEPVDDFLGTIWTERGKDLEPEALAYFELQTGYHAEKVGFIFKDDTRRCGCSPDGVILDIHRSLIAGLEIKCPKASTHVGYLRAGEATKYWPQTQFSLWVTGLPAWYFMSYYPGIRPLLTRIEPIDEWQDAFDKYVPEVLKEVARTIEDYSSEKH